MSLSTLSSPSPSSHNTLQYNLPVAVKHFHVTNSDRRGYNSLYEWKRSKTFFFEIPDERPNLSLVYSDQQNVIPTIHTNDFRCPEDTHVYFYFHYPNKKFCISTLVTLFFSLQRVISRRIQNKYFALIRNKLHERLLIISKRSEATHQNNQVTRTFFNFSYKKYRFKFGIYVPCHFNFNTPNETLCTTPSPIVMSYSTPPLQITNKNGNYYRQGCVHHQKHIFKFKKSSSPSALSSSDTMASSFTLPPLPESKDKLSHLKAIHKKWFNNTITTVTSHRRGIEYQTKYQHLNCDSFNGVPQRYIFCKNYFNPSLISPDHYRKKTLEKQAKHRSHYDKKAKAITISAYHSRKFLGHNTIKQAAKISQYLSPYNRTFYKVIKHLPLSRLSRTPEALPYISTRDHIIVQDKHINPPVKKPKIFNQNDLTNFKDQLTKLLPFIPLSLSDTLDDQLHSITRTFQERQLELIDSPDLLDIAECNRNSSAHMHRLLRKKLPKIFHSPSIEQPDEDMGMIISEQSSANSGPPIFKIHLSQRTIKIGPFQSLCRPLPPILLIRYLGRSTLSHNDASSLKCVKSTHNNGD
ncbi:hypothetical protein GLOIN_2v1828645 [Rhizophagus clarus]|uniref:DUF8211 domain-containing protein n=1 Tax=Rhizophagus clarus TaxID=94130 RepID=A0A8H3QTR5_9GLOM|nr:hypothetical protein GLOIN_2v1828645 [Rhizophagus clarus]